jgi:hypothetical protein
METNIPLQNKLSALKMLLEALRHLQLCSGVVGFQTQLAVHISLKKLGLSPPHLPN